MALLASSCQNFTCEGVLCVLPGGSRHQGGPTAGRAARQAPSCVGGGLICSMRFTGQCAGPDCCRSCAVEQP